MKLSIRRIEISGEAKLALFDSSGAMLPDQRDVTLYQPFGEPTTVTVTFLLGGDVTLSGEPGHLG